jgi:hypothetical protein
MQSLIKLFSTWIQFVYHTFDRVVINGYLDYFKEESNVVHYFHHVRKQPVITKEVLRERTAHYVRWVKSYAAHRGLPHHWVPYVKRKPVRHEDLVGPALKHFCRAKRFGVYYILMSKERGRTFRSNQLRRATRDPNYRMIRSEFSLFRHYYFYIRDPVLGAFALRVGSFLPFQVCAYVNGHELIARELERRQIAFRKEDNAITAVQDPQALQRAANAFTAEVLAQRLNYWAFTLGPKFSRAEKLACKGLYRSWAIQQVEYCWNVIFKKHFPIRHLFERCCELSLYSFTADWVAQIFGHRLTRRLKGKLQTVLERMEHGRHVFRAYWKNCCLRQYEKFRTYMRLEVLSNNLKDLNLRKGLSYLEEVRSTCQKILDRFAAAQTQNLNVHGHFDLLARLAKPVLLGQSKIAGIRLDQVRMMRLLEVLLRRGAGSLGGWNMKELRAAILDACELAPAQYRVSAIRYDMRKLRAHGLIERLPHSHRYRLTAKGQKVAILMTLLRKRVYGPLASSAFVHAPAPAPLPTARIELAYRKADQAFQTLIDAIAA